MLVKTAPAIGITIMSLLAGPTNNLGSAFAQEQNNAETHFNAGIEIFSDSTFKTQGWTFTRGDIAYFSGWSNAYTDGESGLITTPHSNFTIDIIDPQEEVIFHQIFMSYEEGNIRFTLPITEDFKFGIYDVRYAVEKEGYKTINPYSPDPDVNYYPVRFFVTWTKEDVVDVSDRYKLEISSADSSPRQFGSYSSIKASLCPSPLGLVPDHGFLEPTSGEILLDEQGPAITVSAELKPLDEQETRVARNMTTFVRENSCSQPFEIQTGVFNASGRWSVTATAQWLQENDTQHVFQATSNTIIFDVAETEYRSTNVMRISVDTDKYQNTVPLDWSSDGKSILFSHEGEPGEGQKLAVLSLEDSFVTDLDIPFANFSDTMGYPSPYTTKFSPSGEEIMLLLGSDLYSYDLNQKELVKLTDSKAIVSFDIASNGKLFYNSNGTLVIADPDAKNPEIILGPAEHDVYTADLSPDGEKLLYRKYLGGGYGWQDAVLAYYDIDERKEQVIPNIDNGCGSPPKWAPNGFHIVFHESSCSRGWPGGTLSITDVNGSFQEYIIPVSNDNPAYFIFHPDGISILVGFSSFGRAGAVDSMGGPANFYFMTLARPVPEFGPYFVTILFGSMLASIILIAKRFRL